MPDHTSVAKHRRPASQSPQEPRGAGAGARGGHRGRCPGESIRAAGGLARLRVRRQAIDADECRLGAFAISLSTPLTSVERDADAPASLPMFSRDLKAWNYG